MIIPEIHLIFDLLFDFILSNSIYNFHIGTTPSSHRTSSASTLSRARPRQRPPPRRSAGARRRRAVVVIPVTPAVARLIIIVPILAVPPALLAVFGGLADLPRRFVVK